MPKRLTREKIAKALEKMGFEEQMGGYFVSEDGEFTVIIIKK